MPSAGPATQGRGSAGPVKPARDAGAASQAIPSPTVSQFGAYNAAFDYFNRELFGGELPGCFLNFSRMSKALGFFAPERWTNGGETTHEISLNPDHLGRDLRDTMSTLVHEMVHLWQQVLGDPPRRCYHDRQWAAKMEAVGLIPSNTGLPGGKKTGPKMTHYIESGGAFSRAFASMPESYGLPWMSFIPEADEGKPKKKSSKVKHTCPGCGLNVWGKPGLRVTCVECGEELIGPDDDEEGSED